MEGGENGALGEQWKVTLDGNRFSMSGSETRTFEAGEAIEIQTPGGGGFGRREG